ncbi:hypothetical protein GH5_00338 [Leishmania sp. Ghana 2012 LV757]|uniref:hypothetical protein n=1 Tax=Leishmania sp. Ghana 2012 LV757 TaxID=2803181 RepID=UPI001B670FC8|nr:hypothetical protein GH5_00338 [Leishmania sp. Ghana 2012 LV757]
MEVAQDDLITVSSLQSRLSELQTLWNTTARGQEEHLPHSSSASALMVRAAAEEPYGRDVSCVVQLAHCPSRSVAQGPAKPTKPSLASPRSFHRHVPPMFVVLNNEGEDQACHSPASTSHKLLASVGVSFTPHVPSTPPTGTPRARQRSVATTPPTFSPVRTSQEAVTLPPIRAHFVGTVPATCAHCGAKAARVSAAHCGRCGKRLTAVV